MVEFAIVITILMLLFLGAVDYGRFLYYNAALNSAARVGAETAINHCSFSGSGCGASSAAVSDTFVTWRASCEAAPYVTLYPSYASCSEGSSSSWTPTCSTSCTVCSYDICVTPSARSSGTDVTVAVGYSFKPISFYMSPFFSEQSCYSGDSTSTNHHTLCASSTGRVS